MYDADGSAFRVMEVAGGFQLMTRAKFAPWLLRLNPSQTEVRLSAPALETIAVVAYRQPILRADIEAIRGVQCGEILRQLMERDLVRIAGRSDDLGRPFLYGTTRQFLQVFGLRSLDELPRPELFRPADLPVAEEAGPGSDESKDNANPPISINKTEGEMTVKTATELKVVREEAKARKTFGPVASANSVPVRAAKDDDFEEDEELEDEELDEDEDDDFEDDEEEDEDLDDEDLEEDEWEEVDDEDEEELDEEEDDEEEEDEEDEDWDEEDEWEDEDEDWEEGEEEEEEDGDWE